VALNGSGQATSPALSGSADTAVGTYCFQAVYIPTGNFLASQDTGNEAAECFTVQSPTTTVTQSSSTGNVAPGTAVTDTATVTASNGQTPVGTVQFCLVSPGSSSCNNIGSPVALNGSGQATSSAVSGNTDSTPGTYCWQATYTPTLGSNFTGSSGTSTTNECFTVVVSAAIAPTETTCANFVAGPGATGGFTPLTTINYTSSGGIINSNVTPGVFFYYETLTGLTSGQTYTVTVNQSITTTTTNGYNTLFAVPNTSQVNAFNSACGTIAVTNVDISNPAAITFKFTATGSSAIIGVKYSAKSIVGSKAPQPSTINYSWSTSLNPVVGSNPVPGSTTGVQLKPV